MDEYQDVTGDNPYDGEEGSNTIFIGYNDKGEALFVKTTNSDHIYTEAQIIESILDYNSAERAGLTADDIAPTTIYQPKYPEWMPLSQ
jgi:hypothetical protein